MNKEEAITQGELIYYAHELDTGFDSVDIPPHIGCTLW